MNHPSLWSRGQMEICGLFWEFVAPPEKRNLAAIMAQKACLGDLKSHVVLSYQWQVFCK